jgi:hypothetical protein
MTEPKNFYEALAQRHTEDVRDLFSEAIAYLSVKHDWTKETRDDVIDVLVPIINVTVLRTMELAQEAIQQ